MQTSQLCIAGRRISIISSHERWQHKLTITDLEFLLGIKCILIFPLILKMKIIKVSRNHNHHLKGGLMFQMLRWNHQKAKTRDQMIVSTFPVKAKIVFKCSNGQKWFPRFCGLGLFWWLEISDFRDISPLVDFSFLGTPSGDMRERSRN